MKYKPRINAEAEQFTFGAELTAISPKYKDTPKNHGMSYAALSRNNLSYNKFTCITLNNSCRTVEIRCLRAPTTIKEWNMQMQFIRYLCNDYCSIDFSEPMIKSTIPKTLEAALEQFNSFCRTEIYRNAKEDWGRFCIARLKQRFS